MASSNFKRIIHNTVMLYIRTLLTMLVTLYTSRIVLKILGVEDWGIYNVVGSIVVFFAFFNSAMSNATQRFLNFELGKNNQQQLSKIFSASFLIHIILAIIVLLLSEIIGVWFVKHYLNIPTFRLDAAIWVFQFSVLTLIVQIIQVPFNAIIIAYEKMTFYAYLSLLEVSLKLGSVFLLQWIAFDKLKLYAVFVFGIALLVFIVTCRYVKRRFSTSRIILVKDKELYVRLTTFSGWSLLGCSADVGYQQGVNILLNIFWGVVVNAAMGIANQVSTALQRFVSNFQTAFNPQIVKLYASDNRSELTDLVFRASRYSFFLLLFLSVPILIEIDWLLSFWLTTVPVFARELCILSIIIFLLETFSAPLSIVITATGQIKRYQICLSALLLLNLPLSYFVLKIGALPFVVLVIRLFVAIGVLAMRIFFSNQVMGLDMLKYWGNCLYNVLFVSFLSFCLPFCLHVFLPLGILRFVIVICCSFLTTSIVILYCGMNKNERFSLFKVVKNKLRIRRL